MNRYRDTWAEIDLDRLFHNLEETKRLAPCKEIIPVIKADAYGHGAKEIYTFLIEKGVTVFAVSLLEEALSLREVNRDAEIIMLGAIAPHQLEVASLHNIHITIHDEMIYRAVINSKHHIKCHLKIDTGMSRYGFREPLRVIEIINDLQSLKHIDLVGVYTHFATANDDYDFYLNQLNQFKSILNQLKNKPRMIHISNSSSTLKYEHLYDFTTHVRLGISLYGLSKDDPKQDLKQVMSLKSKVVTLKYLLPGDAVGYGATYHVKKDEIIAILPIGYADGFIRKNKVGHVEINGKLFKIVGIICMDAMFIKVDETVKVGDTAILYGDKITINEVATRTQTITYEVTCLVSARVPRCYLKGGKTV
jgi:alanine racemase